MIGESLYFSFDGIKSTNYPIVNVIVGQGAYREQFATSRQIVESYPRNAFKPYFMGIVKEPAQISVSFAFEEPWNDEMIEQIIQWLIVDDYKELFFEGNIDRVFYAIPVTNMEVVHNGLKQGYVTIVFRCDSAYSYSHRKTTTWYDMSTSNRKREFTIKNLGHYSTFPEIEIVKINNGNIMIQNTTNANQTAEIKNLKDRERIVIDCMNEELETNLENTYRFDDFNDEYIELIRGDNNIKVTGNCFIRFKYQYVYNTFS